MRCAEDVTMFDGVTHPNYVLLVGPRSFGMSNDLLGNPPFRWTLPDPLLARCFHVYLPPVILPRSLQPAELRIEAESIFEMLLRVLYLRAAVRDDNTVAETLLVKQFKQVLATMAVYADFIGARHALPLIGAVLSQKIEVFDIEMLQFARSYGLRNLQQRCLYSWLLAEGPLIENEDGVEISDLVDAVYGQADCAMKAFLEVIRVVARIEMPAEELLHSDYVIVIEEAQRMRYITEMVKQCDFGVQTHQVIKVVKRFRSVLQLGVQNQIELCDRILQQAIPQL